MRIIKDFNDYKIINIDENFNNTKIALDFFISRKIPSTSIGVYLNLNAFFVKEYMLSNYSMLQNVQTGYIVENHDGFYRVKLEVTFENKDEFKHLQQIRDYIFLNILGVEGNEILSSQHALNLHAYLKSLKNLNCDDERSQVQEIMLKSHALNKFGLNVEAVKILTSFDTTFIIKEYIKARVDFFNFMFKKNLVVFTKFDNYKSFYNTIFNNITAGFTYEEISLANVKLHALNKLVVNEYKGQIYSNLNFNALGNKIGNQILRDSMQLFITWQKLNSVDYEIINLQNSSFVVLNKWNDLIVQKYLNFYNDFVDAKLGEYKDQLWIYINELIKNGDILEILFIANYANIEANNFSQLLVKIQTEVEAITFNDIKKQLRYKTF